LSITLNCNLFVEVAAEHSDAWLITKVKTTLFFHGSVSATGTEVFAKDGTITLRGKADSAAQKDMTTEYAKNAAEKDLATKLVSDVHGVNKIVNTMTTS
jgi:osmotically-inducible protein OsmY